MDTPHAAQARNRRWNGGNVLVRDPEDRLPSVRPTLHPSRELFYQDHLVRAQREAEIAVEALRVAESILQPRQMPSGGLRRLRIFGQQDKLRADRSKGT